MANLELESMGNLISELERLGEFGEKIEKIALVKAGEKIKEAIIRGTPQKSGKLKQGIKVSKLKKMEVGSFVEVYPSKNVYYAAFLEFSTSKMAANSFMSRGYETSKEEAERAIEEEIRRGLGL